MSNFSHIMRHALAAVGAMTISAVLLANTLAVQAHQVQSVAGILA
jgi:hypothetical protein